MITSLSGSFTGLIAYRNNTTTPFRGTFDSRSLEFDPFGHSGAMDALSDVSVANDITAFIPLTGSFIGVPPGAVVPVQAQFLNLTLDGGGYFIVIDPNAGTPLYTRNLLLTIGLGQALSFGPYPVQPSLTLPLDTTNIFVAPDGTVSVTIGVDPTPMIIGQFQLADFATPPTDVGGGFFIEGASSPIQDVPGNNGYGTIKQGFLEERNNARGDVADVVIRIDAVITSTDNPELTFAVVYESGNARLIGSIEAIDMLRTDDHFASMFNNMLQNATGDSNIRVEAI